MGRMARFDGIIISHLGNIDGRQPELENTLKYVQASLKAGWHVCVDVQLLNGGFVLPNENGFSVAPPSFFSQQRVWSRCYNAETLDALCTIGAHAFMGGEIPLSLTTAQFIWTMPPRELSPRSIAAFPELAEPSWLDNYEPAGLCSNEPARYI
jgi:hypothetical protein